MLKKKKGAALAAVLMVLVILSILGASLLSISENENKLSINNERKMQAYYIARSGADAVAAWIEDPKNDVSSIIPAVGNVYTSENTRIGEGVFSVEISRDNDNPSIIKIESNSILDNGNVKGKVIVTLKGTSNYTADKVFADVIFGKEVSFGGSSSVYGIVESNGKINISNIVGDKIEESKKVFPEPIIPKLNEISNYNNEISDNGEYKIISGKDLNFYTNGKSLNVVVDNLIVNDINIYDGGRVYLYVKGDVDINGQVNADGKNKSVMFGDPKSIFIFVKSGEVSVNNGKFDMSGFLYAPNSDLAFHGNINYNGSIIARNITGTGNINVYYKKIETGEINDFPSILWTSYQRTNWSGN